MERNGTLMPSQRSCNSSTRNQRFMINTTYHRAANEINFIIRAIFFPVPLASFNKKSSSQMWYVSVLIHTADYNPSKTFLTTAAVWI